MIKLERDALPATHPLLLDDVEWQRRWAVLESRVLGPRAPYLAMVRQAFLDDFDLVR